MSSIILNILSTWVCAVVSSPHSAIGHLILFYFVLSTGLLICHVFNIVCHTIDQKLAKRIYRSRPIVCFLRVLFYINFLRLISPICSHFHVILLANLICGVQCRQIVQHNRSSSSSSFFSHTHTHTHTDKHIRLAWFDILRAVERFTHEEHVFS